MTSGDDDTRPRDRAQSFCDRFGLKMPILLAPMAGACPASLSIAVANAGSMGAMGALLATPDGIREWVGAVRAASPGPFQLNTWVPDPPPRRDADAEARVRAFLATWGPEVPASAGDVTRPGIDEQCEAFLEAKPAAVSSIMGLFAPRFVERFKADGIAWFATATTLAEARQAEAAGADAIIAQGFEAGGHRGSFDERLAERQAVGLFALIPRLADHVGVPIIATGGIGDGRGVAAALTLGASAVAIGTAFLRCPEAQTHRAWSDALAGREPEDTMPTRALTGRLARAIATDFVKAAAIARRAAAGAVPGAARSHGADEGGRRRRGRLSPDAALGRPVGGDGASGVRRGSRPGDLGTGAGTAFSRVLSPAVRQLRWTAAHAWTRPTDVGQAYQGPLRCHSMDLETQFGQIDIYLFDQLLRGRIRPGMRVFDAGCGHGRNLIYLLRSGYDVCGSDADPASVARVQHLAASLAPALPSDELPGRACRALDLSRRLRRRRRSAAPCCISRGTTSSSWRWCARCGVC